MTPQEKAKELVEKMFQYSQNGMDNFSFLDRVEIRKENAKQCALIAVEEIRKLASLRTSEYWNTVKEEIEKL